MLPDTDLLSYLGGPDPSGDRPLFLVVMHNERSIIEDLFAHYRAFGPMDMIVVDDHSTDGTRDYLLEQGDLTIYAPKPGSSYARHKTEWRGQLLDRYGTGRWCLTPDADEHLVWADMETRSFHQLLAGLDREGAEAYVADMVDMYDDRPLADHIATAGRLIDQFPFFDDPVSPLSSYRVLLSPNRRHRLRCPTPNTESYGGMRDRVFNGGVAAHGPLRHILLSRCLTGPRVVGPDGLWRNALVARLLIARRGSMPLVMNKVALVKWSDGMRFSGGQHHVTKALPLSRETGAYLHFPITRGSAGLSYISARGQHASGSKHYRKALERDDILARSPVFAGSRRYVKSTDLMPLLSRPAPVQSP